MKKRSRKQKIQCWIPYSTKSNKWHEMNIKHNFARIWTFNRYEIFWINSIVRLSFDFIQHFIKHHSQNHCVYLLCAAKYLSYEVKIEKSNEINSNERKRRWENYQSSNIADSYGWIDEIHVSYFKSIFILNIDSLAWIIFRVNKSWNSESKFKINTEIRYKSTMKFLKNLMFKIYYVKYQRPRASNSTDQDT